MSFKEESSEALISRTRLNLKLMSRLVLELSCDCLIQKIQT